MNDFKNRALALEITINLNFYDKVLKEIEQEKKELMEELTNKINDLKQREEYHSKKFEQVKAEWKDYLAKNLSF